jgi:hypothetical protein
VTVNGPFRKRAVAVRAADIDSVQTSFPLQSPLQPTNEWEGSRGLAVRLTMVPEAKLAEHPVLAARPAVIVQLMPAGLDVASPVPVPLPVTVRTMLAAAPTAGDISVPSGGSWQP